VTQTATTPSAPSLGGDSVTKTHSATARHAEGQGEAAPVAQANLRYAAQSHGGVGSGTLGRAVVPRGVNDEEGSRGAASDGSCSVE
jgi:hypothetical protein